MTIYKTTVNPRGAGPELRVLLVDPAMTDEEIVEIVKGANEICLAENTAFYLSVSGYDEDSRELWEIPEALTLFDRLAKVGCMSVLEVNANPAETVPLIGAYQLWLINNRLVEGNDFPLTRKLFNQFIDDLKSSNATIEAL